MGMLMGGIQTIPPIPLEHTPYDGQILNYYWFGHVWVHIRGYRIVHTGGVEDKGRH